MLDKFMKSMERVNFYLKVLGLLPDKDDDQRNILQRLINHRIYILHIICFNMQVIVEILWVYNALRTGMSFLDITFLLPCLALRLLSNLKSFSLLFYAHHVNDLIKRIDKLQVNLESYGEERKKLVKKLIDTNVSEVINISVRIVYLIIVGISMFALAPVYMMCEKYYQTGVWELVLPYVGYYPFNETYVLIYPIIYVHQMYAATQAVLFVYGPDCLFFTCCTFINIQFLVLQYDMEKIVDEDVNRIDRVSLKANIKKLAVRHIELMTNVLSFAADCFFTYRNAIRQLSCVEIVEIIYSKSTLFNAWTSSVIICVTGFNVLANDNIVTMASFMSFLTFSMLRIFFYCYYGDHIMRSSEEVSSAIYNSQWYNIDPKERRSFLIMLVRSQKPCRLTAYGFFNVNLNAFTSILSSSWSYFALLKTMYHPE